MSSNTKQIVSMLASETNIMLFTSMGEVLDMKIDGPYDTTGIAEYLTPKLDGKSVVEIDLSKYMTIAKAIIPEGYENNGIVVTHEINGQKVQGIFYPQKVSVAVIHEGEQVIIPDVEKLQKQANRAAAEDSPSVRNFLRRIAPVVKDRKHSAEDLMSFIERSELPFTNDGLIIGYKKVNQKKNGMFVDVHSGKIEQQVGSHVWMDVDAVDPDRNRSCSHGLHVANLGYLSGFSGSHVLIVLVDPANFIAVPHGETNKARVCAYDVIGVMTASAKQMVDSGAFVTGEQTFKSVIQDAIVGKAIKPFEAVEVGDRKVLSRVQIKGREIPAIALEEAKPNIQPSGESLNQDVLDIKDKKDIVKMSKEVIKNSSGAKPWDEASQDVIKVFEALYRGDYSKTAIASKFYTSTRTIGRWQDKYDYEGWVKAKEAPVMEEVAQSVTGEVQPLTVAEQALAMFNAGDFQGLAAFKKAKKKSYSSLGFSSKEEAQIMKTLQS